MKHLLIIITTLDIDNWTTIVDIFDKAKVASKDYQVEIVLTGDSGIIAAAPEATAALGEWRLSKIYESMRSAKSSGIKISICERAIEWCGVNNKIIPEIDSILSSSSILGRATANTYVTYF